MPGNSRAGFSKEISCKLRPSAKHNRGQVKIQAEGTAGVKPRWSRKEANMAGTEEMRGRGARKGWADHARPMSPSTS